MAAESSLAVVLMKSNTKEKEVMVWSKVLFKSKGDKGTLNGSFAFTLHKPLILCIVSGKLESRIAYITI